MSKNIFIVPKSATYGPLRYVTTRPPTRSLPSKITTSHPDDCNCLPAAKPDTPDTKTGRIK